MTRPSAPREWLLTNGLGGYALGPLEGPATRGYHGWLVAATRPPDGRILYVSAVEATLEVEGVAHPLVAIALRAGVAHPAGTTVRLEAAMAPLANATILRYSVDGTPPGSTIRLAPRLAGRDHHPADGLVRAPADVEIDADGRSATVTWPDGVPPLRLLTSHGTWRRVDRAVEVDYPEERARGTATGERLAVPLELVADATGPVTMVLACGAGSEAPLPVPGRDTDVILAAGSRDDAGGDPPRRLREAASRFLVRRPDASTGTPGTTVIAGYPWFGDWGRDTMIALPGLTLATGRPDVAAGILRTWAGLVRDGLLPNHFPEAARGEPAYHAIDAPLWFVHAVGAHAHATGDPALGRELRPAVEAILAAYRHGTRFGIGADPDDGLVRGGEPGLQLTWMDARVDGRVITPRHGKPVEIQALWVAALRVGAAIARADGDEPAAGAHEALAARAIASFRRRFVRDDVPWLLDVVDDPDGDDASLRPNQLLAISLVDDLVPADVAARVVAAVAEHLVVPGGVRTLARFEPGYRPAFQGPPEVRDAAYHQGPAWTWLLGPWIDAVERVRGVDAARAELVAAIGALGLADEDGTGAVPELLEPEPPHDARGCPWQAWGVAELLRCVTRLAAHP